LVKQGTWKRNEANDGWMPCCNKCGKPYPDAHIGDVKNYPEDGAIAVFFTCEECGEESDFTYNPAIRLCPRCKLPMPNSDVLNAISHDGKTIICTTCGQIESLEKFAPERAEGLRIAQKRAQAAMYGLDKDGEPKLPITKKSLK